MISVTGSIVGFAGAICLAIPVLQVLGGILLGVGILGNLLSGLFKSKDKKIKEAQDKLYESIRNSFEENMGSTISDVILGFSKVIDRTEKQIENLFTILITELDRLIKEMEPLKKSCENYESNLNKLYALRVLNFAKGKDMFDINDSSLLSHVKVKHDFAKRLSIKTDLVKQIDSEKLKHILQEDIVLEAL